MPMTAWTTDELDNIDAADELEIASVRSDGMLRNPTTIWVVRLGDDLYVRSVNGRTGTWFRAPKIATKHGSRPAASGRTFSSSRRKTWATRSTPPTATSTA